MPNKIGSITLTNYNDRSERVVGSAQNINTGIRLPKQVIGTVSSKMANGEAQAEETKNQLIKTWQTLRIINTKYVRANQIQFDDTYEQIHYKLWLDTSELVAKQLQAIFNRYLNELVPVTAMAQSTPALDIELHLRTVDYISDQIHRNMGDHSRVFDPFYSEVELCWRKVKLQMRNTMSARSRREE